MEATRKGLTNDGSNCAPINQRAVRPPPPLMHKPHAPLMPQTEPIEVPSLQRRPTSRKPRRAPTPPLCKGPAEMMKILTLDGEWRTMGASPLAAAHELLDGDEQAPAGLTMADQTYDDCESAFAPAVVHRRGPQSFVKRLEATTDARPTALEVWPNELAGVRVSDEAPPLGG